MKLVNLHIDNEIRRRRNAIANDIKKELQKELGDDPAVDDSGPGVGGIGDTTCVPTVCEGDCNTTACFFDGFNRADDVQWGFSDSGRFWDYTESGVVTGGEVVNNTGLLISSPTINTGTSTSISSNFVTTEVVDLGCPAPPGDFYFTFWWQGTNWSADFTHNTTPTGTYWTPGFRDDPAEVTNSTPSGPWCRQWLQVGFKNISIPHHHIRLYNAEGSFWASILVSNSVSQDSPNPPTLIRASPVAEGERMRVHVHIDSVQARLTVWPEADPEPATWQIETQSAVSPYDDQIELHGLTTVRGTGTNYQSTDYEIFIDDINLDSACFPTHHQATSGRMVSEGSDVFSTPTLSNKVLNVFLDGVRMQPTNHYTENGNGTITTTHSSVRSDSILRSRYLAE